MKIAFIGQKGIPAKQGGIEKHVEELSKHLVDFGFDVTVYSRPHYTGNYNNSYKNIKLVNLPSLKSKNLDAISHTFISSIHALFQDYDVIHYHGVGPSLLSFIPRIFKPKTKVVVTFHCLDREHQKWSHFAKLMLTLGEWTACRFPHETITVSKTLREYCQKKFNRDTTYIPNGVELSEIDNKIVELDKFNLKPQEYIVAISRLVQHKGLHTLINAYNQLATDKKLVIVGGSSNTDEYVERLKGMAAGNANIIFTGAQSGEALEALFKNAYLFVQPSESEGLSIALLEAMAYGVPTLVSNITENMEVAENVSLSFTNKDVNDLAKKLQYALDNKENLNQLAEAAKDKIKKEYLWSDIAKKTGHLYDGLMIPVKTKIKPTTVAK